MPKPACFTPLWVGFWGVGSGSKGSCLRASVVEPEPDPEPVKKKDLEPVKKKDLEPKPVKKGLAPQHCRA